MKRCAACGGPILNLERRCNRPRRYCSSTCGRIGPSGSKYAVMISEVLNGGPRRMRPCVRCGKSFLTWPFVRRCGSCHHDERKSAEMFQPFHAERLA